MKTIDRNSYEIYDNLYEGRTLYVDFEDDTWMLQASEDGGWEITSEEDDDYSCSYDDLSDAIDAINNRGEISDYWF